ncbi:MAG: SDR family NAD(P)-dependent oxidoreductase [Gammaproteobacteria bacterium]|nr:SDR family NAD(P)-dependent oxidoreductase [Gammaproteobacteria bacterium]
MPLEAHTLKDFEEFFSINVRGPMVLTQLLLPALKMRQGAITNVSSAVVIMVCLTRVYMLLPKGQLMRLREAWQLN